MQLVALYLIVTLFLFADATVQNIAFILNI